MKYSNVSEKQDKDYYKELHQQYKLSKLSKLKGKVENELLEYIPVEVDDRPDITCLNDYVREFGGNVPSLIDEFIINIEPTQP